MVEQENLFFLTLYKLPWQSMANISKLLWSLIRFHCRWTSSAWKRGMEKQQQCLYQLHPFYTRNTDGSTGNHKSESQQARWMVDVLFQLRNFHSKFYAPRPLFYRWYASASILPWYALVIMSKTSTPLKIPQLQSWKQRATTVVKLLNFNTFESMMGEQVVYEFTYSRFPNIQYTHQS